MFRWDLVKSLSCDCGPESRTADYLIYYNPAHRLKGSNANITTLDETTFWSPGRNIVKPVAHTQKNCMFHESAEIIPVFLKKTYFTAVFQKIRKMLFWDSCYFCLLMIYSSSKTFITSIIFVSRRIIICFYC